ncbi:hypothetical protein AGLY_009898 [Aphis glycines]|uniref:Uncharacterized protein n=1 Tax=Aphis glycines TaxID=307491 RepID=A0A6G0TH52_APHGL|nr:hypothetical protein AGLY_009898 [Aphis glycines]
MVITQKPISINTWNFHLIFILVVDKNILGDQKNLKISHKPFLFIIYNRSKFKFLRNMSKSRKFTIFLQIAIENSKRHYKEKCYGRLNFKFLRNCVTITIYPKMILITYLLGIRNNHFFFILFIKSFNLNFGVFRPLKHKPPFSPPTRKYILRCEIISVQNRFSYTMISIIIGFKFNTSIDHYSDLLYSRTPSLKRKLNLVGTLGGQK